jgi:electron transfer flavoprotein alpha/beta subunit
MSSSSDIEKLFDHFGGDANAYQEIGRENEARSARTRWPLLVTLDLTQPTIPAIGQRREVAREPLVRDAAPADDGQDTTPKDATSVTRAKAPLFTRSHRRDIPPM